MKIECLEIKEQEDRSAIATFNLDEEASDLFFRWGLKHIFSEYDVNIVKPNANLNSGNRTFEISDRDYEEVVNIGILEALKNSLNS